MGLTEATDERTNTTLWSTVHGCVLNGETPEMGMKLAKSDASKLQNLQPSLEVVG
jgi:hypothetical protein